MVPSPRKRATRPAFDQTWDDTDAALFNPDTLPVARIPRGWERKQETKRTDQGKEKTIWRRFNLRSRAPTTPEDIDEDTRDARSRPVKKLQHMSPKAMEKSTTGRNGKKRTFKATRWDRRKSVLPRKNATRNDESTLDPKTVLGTDNDPEDQEEEDLSDSNITGTHEDSYHIPEDTQTLLPEEDNRRSTFTFTMDAELADDSSANIDVDEEACGEEEPEDDTTVEEPTISRLFRSPTKGASLLCNTDDTVEYPQLPHSDSEDVLLEENTEAHIIQSPQMAPHITAPTTCEDEVSTSSKQETLPLERPSQLELSKQSSEADATSTSNDLEPQSNSIIQTSTIADNSQSPLIATSETLYPALPVDIDIEADTELPIDDGEPPNNDMEMSEVAPDVMIEAQCDSPSLAEEDLPDAPEMDAAEEEFTEASLQLNIQRDFENALREEQADQPDVERQEYEENAAYDENDLDPSERTDVAAELPGASIHSESHTDDITDGLTLSFTPAKPASAAPTPRKLQSPPPPPRTQSGPEDVTMTIALDDDTALLKDFLNRAAASKAEKAAVLTHRRESLQNRRDSDVIRHALASPRKVLEDKDPNSPSKYDQEATLDLSQTLSLNMNNEVVLDQADIGDTTGERSERGSRRSSRTKKSRLPAPASATQAQASKIAIRRADGTEHVVLKKSDAQEMALLTRANTRKNKQGAFGVTVRLLKLAADAGSLPPLDDSTKELIVGKNVRWDQQLAYYQENPETVAERESLETPDELSMPDSSSTSSAKPKSKVSKNSTPKIRRVRGLGTANGTPGKGLLEPASLLPEAVQDEQEAAQARTQIQQLARPKASKIKKMPVAPTTDLAPTTTPSDTKLPTLEFAPVGIEPTKERKSRLAAPKKVMLPQPVASMPAVEGKENTQRTGLSAATPKKGIPAPKVVIPPTVGMESGLPRRRGRKM